MKVQDLVKELEEKECFKTFKDQNPDTYFSVAFLILDITNRTEQVQLDYYLPKTNKIAAFEYPFKEPKIHDNIISVSKEGQTRPATPKQMQKQTKKNKLDIDNLEPKCNELIKENNSFIKPTKIIAILKDDIWNLTCMDNALGIVRIKVFAISEELLDFNKGGLMDFMGIKKK